MTEDEMLIHFFQFDGKDNLFFNYSILKFMVSLNSMNLT